MKKLYMAIGCLAFMQTSAFSLKLINATDVDGTVFVHELIQRQFDSKELVYASHDDYAPTDTNKTVVSWTMVDGDTVRCDLSNIKSLDDLAEINIFGSKGERKCISQ